MECVLTESAGVGFVDESQDSANRSMGTILGWNWIPTRYKRLGL